MPRRAIVRSLSSVLLLSCAVVFWQGCGGGGGASTPTSPSAADNTPLTADEQNAVNATVESIMTAFTQQALDAFSGQSVAGGPTLEIHSGGWQGSVPCPGGGSVSGGGSGTFNDETGAVRGQGSASSNECLSADGMLNLTGTLMAQISGSCPGSVRATATGNVTLSRRGTVGWVPVENSYGILQTVTVGC